MDLDESLLSPSKAQLAQTVSLQICYESISIHTHVHLDIFSGFQPDRNNLL